MLRTNFIVGTVDVVLQPFMIMWAQNTLLSMQFLVELGKVQHTEYKSMLYTSVHLSQQCIRPLPFHTVHWMGRN